MLLDILLIAAGSLIVAVVLFDLFSTTISMSSVRGPISSRLSESLWSIGRRASGTPFAAVQRGAGPLLILVTLVGWLLSLTVGWSLIFSVDGALESSAEPEQTTSRVRWIDAFFYVFGGLIGRGQSSLAPNEVIWSTVVALMTLTGVGLITLALAWILPVVSAVVQKRSLAAQIGSLGAAPQDIVLRCWNGSTLGNLDLHLLPLVSELTLLAQRHLAFPVIHYFHSADERTAIALRIAALDEALTLIEACGLDEGDDDTGLDRSTTEPLRRALSDYLATLQHVFIDAADETPPPPAHERLVEAGLADRATISRRLDELCDELAERRALMLGYLGHDGWTWDAMDRDETAGARRRRGA